MMLQELYSSLKDDSNPIQFGDESSFFIIVAEEDEWRNVALHFIWYEEIIFRKNY